MEMICFGRFAKKSMRILKIRVRKTNKTKKDIAEEVKNTKKKGRRI